jgi:hypothetical protein
MGIPTKSADVESEEFFVLHKIEDVETILDLARNPNERNERYLIRHNQKTKGVKLGLPARWCRPLNIGGDTGLVKWASLIDLT